jgi:hypothetical protein
MINYFCPIQELIRYIVSRSTPNAYPFNQPPRANPLLGGVPDRAGWVNLRDTTSSNLLRSIHSTLEGFSWGVYPPCPEGHPSQEGICLWEGKYPHGRSTIPIHGL